MSVSLIIFVLLLAYYIYIRNHSLIYVPEFLVGYIILFYPYIYDDFFGIGPVLVTYVLRGILVIAVALFGTLALKRILPTRKLSKNIERLERPIL